jgi:hypothetical protein
MLSRSRTRLDRDASFHAPVGENGALYALGCILPHRVITCLSGKLDNQGQQTLADRFLARWHGVWQRDVPALGKGPPHLPAATNGTTLAGPGTACSGEANPCWMASLMGQPGQRAQHWHQATVVRLHGLWENAEDATDPSARRGSGLGCQALLIPTVKLS